MVKLGESKVYFYHEKIVKELKRKCVKEIERASSFIGFGYKLVKSVLFWHTYKG